MADYKEYIFDKNFICESYPKHYKEELLYVKVWLKVLCWRVKCKFLLFYQRLVRVKSGNILAPFHRLDVSAATGRKNSMRLSLLTQAVF